MPSRDACLLVTVKNPYTASLASSPACSQPKLDDMNFNFKVISGSFFALK